MKNFFRNIALLGVFVASSQAAIIVYTTPLSGPQESPPNGSPGTGFARVTTDSVLNTMRVQVDFSGLTGTVTASHIHCCTTVPLTGTAGVATTTPTFAGFPLGVTAGSYDVTLDMLLASSYNPAYVTANGGTAASAEAALFNGLTAGKAYLNIHSTTFGGGEIRGFLQPVPEPATVGLCGSALLALGLLRLRRQDLNR